MAEVKIRADAGNLQRGIKVTTQQAQKLTKALTQKKVPLLHAQETQKSVKANAQFSRGLVQSARGMKQVNRQAQLLAQTQQRQISMQKQMIQQQREYIQLLKQTQGTGGSGGGAPVGGVTGRLRSFRKGLDSRIGKASAPFGELKKIIGSVKGIAGAFLAPIAVPVAAMAALGSRGTATAMQRQAAQSQLFGITGRRSNLGGLGAAGMGLGFTQAQSFQLAGQQAQAFGNFSRGNTVATMRMSRAYGLNPGALLQLQQATRMTGAQQAGTAFDINNALVAGLKSGRFSSAMMNEFASTLTGIFGSMQDRAMRVNMRVVSGIVGTAGRQMGGRFARSPLATGRLLSRTDAALRGGQGAGQAMMLSALMRQGMNYGQAMERLQEGLFAGNNFATFLKVSRQFGTDTAMGRVIAGQAFGMSPLDLRALQKIDPSTVTGTRAGAAGGGGARVSFGGRTFSQQSQNAAMIRQRAQQATGMNAIQLRQIRTAEQFADLRIKMDPAYAAANKLLVMGLNKLSGQIGSLLNKIQSAGLFGR